MILVLDIDNTLADCSHRVHLLKDGKNVEDLKKFMAVEEVAKDPPFPKAQEALKKILPQCTHLFVVTGRNEYLRETTEKWLEEHFSLKTSKYNLIMRPTGELSHATEHKVNRLNLALAPIFIETLEYAFEHNLKHNIPLLFIDDDPFVLHEYSKQGIALKAPECWDLLIHEKPEEKEPLWGK